MFYESYPVMEGCRSGGKILEEPQASQRPKRTFILKAASAAKRWQAKLTPTTRHTLKIDVLLEVWGTDEFYVSEDGSVAVLFDE